MKRTTVLIVLIQGALAQIISTCKDFSFDAVTEVLSAECVPSNMVGYVTTALNLNDCFAYTGGQILARTNGNYGQSCEGCHLYIAPDPVYGYPKDTYWMNCTCRGQSAEVAVSLEDTAGSQWVTNQNGHLVC
ncbi:hypothetical protein TGAM01_v208962 [Trichoderma gamsii]|uniref:Cyanovirin-N domain-containing protein n=1 Tax=Trichoderma gamsii TaxID=398673 RepID=A0A2P4ZCR1_9HYPO|nr:hypothetical protein TGAM01_v208962 [Trichoderma gamsii]PON22088.1 hypothetical protein TGAM01_v208962 [Trichoderma gamsii]